MQSRLKLPLSACLVGAVATAPSAAPVLPANLDPDYTLMSLEELLNVDVTEAEVATSSTGALDATAAVYVVTAEDIRRSGASSIPDLLRMVPGVHVAQLQTGAWAVSARGFADQFADKMLVLIDGRSVYTPLFAGVFWDAVDVVLEDVERIEVTRGPGAARWGANAVNGVVNIITRSSEDTQGLLLSTTVGTSERAAGVARYGSTLDDGTHYRAWAKGFYRDSMDPLGAGESFDDDQRMVRAGFRFDQSGETETFTVQGDAYYGVVRAPRTAPGTVVDTFVTKREDQLIRGANLLARWTEKLYDDSSLVLQLYYDGTVRDAEPFEEGRDTFDVDLRHRFPWTERQELAWGLGYRLTSSLIDSSREITFDPEERTDNLLSAFVEDEITLVRGRLGLTLGTKVEHNDYTQFEVQPSTRLLWTPSEAHTVWASISRAVQTPSQAAFSARVETAFTTVATQPTHFVLIGNDQVISQELWAYELGHRARVSESVSLDTAVFVHDYDDLQTNDLGAFGPDPNVAGQFQQDVLVDNNAEALSWGVEVASQWNVSKDWRLHAGYAFLHMDFELDTDSTDPNVRPPDRRYPSNLAHLRSYWNVSETVELDTAVYWVDELDVGVSSYLRADARVGWRPSEAFEFSVGVRGMFHDGETEFDRGFFGDLSETRSEVYLKLTWTPRTRPAPAPEPPPVDTTPGDLVMARL